MNILISGMEMPKEGSWTTVRIYPDGTCAVPNWQGDCALIKGAKAVPVPPHGRCVDADELAALVRANISLFDSAPGRMGADQKLVRAWLASMVDDIEEAPTVLEAEEGE